LVWNPSWFWCGLSWCFGVRCAGSRCGSAVVRVSRVRRRLCGAVLPLFYLREQFAQESGFWVWCHKTRLRADQGPVAAAGSCCGFFRVAADLLVRG